jgi:hypothetical protein
MVDISDIKPFKRCPKQWMPLGKEAPKAKSRPRKVSESKFLKARATRDWIWTNLPLANS